MKKNVKSLSPVITDKIPLVRVEPSTILTFRDAYPELVNESLIEEAKKLAKSTFTIEEFITREFSAGRISKDQFTKEAKEIKFHGHCQQKALSGTSATKTMLSIPENYIAEEIPSGCCGMAGSFGYEEEYYELSMILGGCSSIREAKSATLIFAPGASCRHQIKN